MTLLHALPYIFAAVAALICYAAQRFIAHRRHHAARNHNKREEAAISAATDGLHAAGHIGQGCKVAVELKRHIAAAHVWR